MQTVLCIIALALTVMLYSRRAEASDVGIAEFVKKNEAAMVKEWFEAILIPGKSRKEQQRGEWFKRKFADVGMQDIGVDEVGNVWGYRYGEPDAETILLAGHMDSVFELDTPLSIDVRDGWVYCPGCSDDVPAPVALLWLKRAIDAGVISPKANLIFLATVQEEVGLRGMKYYMEHTKKKPDMVIAIDGQLGEAIAGGLGINWYTVYAKTPAGHTLHSTGKPSATKSIALAITEAYKHQVTSTPQVFLNLGVLGGGTTANAICEEAWVTIDIRSEDSATLKKASDQVLCAMQRAIEDSGGTFRKECTEEITAAQFPNAADHKLVKTAIECVKHVGYPNVQIGYQGATDGNVAIAHGVPAVSVGIVEGENWHSLAERAKVDTFAVGMRQLLMMLEQLA